VYVVKNQNLNLFSVQRVFWWLPFLNSRQQTKKTQKLVKKVAPGLLINFRVNILALTHPHSMWFSATTNELYLIMVVFVYADTG